MADQALVSQRLAERRARVVELARDGKTVAEIADELSMNIKNYAHIAALIREAGIEPPKSNRSWLAIGLRTPEERVESEIARARFGGLVDILREKYTYPEVCTMIGLNVRELKKAQTATGSRHNWTLSQMYRLAKVFDCTLTDLMLWAFDPRRQPSIPPNGKVPE